MDRSTTITAIDDLLRGANFLSASGGGVPVQEREHLLADLRAGRAPEIRPLDAFSDDDVLFCCCYSGSIAPESFADSGDAARALGGEVVHERPFVEAVRLLERQLGVRCAGLISIEIGGLNVGAVLAAANALGVPVADADYSGRAIPELHASGLGLHDVDVLPFATVDHYDNRVVILDGPSMAWTERLAKHLALAAMGFAGCAFAALPVTDVRRIAIPGTISACGALGAAIRTAAEAGLDPVVAAAEHLDGWVLFRGTVSDRRWTNTGYMEGTHELAGSGEFEGRLLRVWFRNENHVSWLDGERWVASPDLIEFCDPDTGEPLVNTDLVLGQRIAVVGRRRQPSFDSTAGLDALGPAHFGFEEAFPPIESLAL